jgi:peptidoglycan/xylan/chitin deacetylase (PgdA/CDA1 family)
LKKITLTFDNGPDPEVTPRVLDVLARHGIRTTFFVIGDKLRDRRALCERAHREGHWIGNHTFNHLTPLGLSRFDGTPALEIEATQRLIGDLAHPLKLFRPFGGGGHLNRALLNRACRDHLVAQGYTCVLWNAVPRDWEDPVGWVPEALRLCREIAWPLIVLHDIQTRAMEWLDEFLTAARALGEFVQEFPPDCVPIVQGRTVRPLDAYVT